MSKPITELHPEDRRIERWLSYLLRGGVNLSLVLLLVAFILNHVKGQSWMSATDMEALTSGASTLRSEPPRNLAQFFYGFRDLESINFVQTGILVLILLPAFRVAFLLGSFIRQRDWALGLAAAVVLLIMSLGTILHLG